MIRKIKEWIFWNILHRKVIYIKVKDAEEIKKFIDKFNELCEEAADDSRN